ncbi:MAG: endonuclease domain-containing protein, partial [Luteimonas sp.]
MKGQTSKAIIIPKLPRRLRNAMTDAERHLWQALRGRQLDGCKFRRQHPFGDSILDFVCLDRMLVIEVDGGQHADSRTDPARDCILEKAGFEVLRFWNHDVLQHRDAVADHVHRRLVARKSQHPHPGPPLEGEGDKHSQE